MNARTMMLEELQDLLETVAAGAEQEQYGQAVLEENCTGRNTLSASALGQHRRGKPYIRCI